MKRDLDLIRKILLEVESCDDPGGIRDSMGINIKGYSTALTNYHVGLVIDAGWVTGTSLNTLESSSKFYFNLNLTNTGHEFLDNAKNESVWQTVKKDLGSKWGSVSFSVLQTLLNQAALKLFGGS